MKTQILRTVIPVAVLCVVLVAMVYSVSIRYVPIPSTASVKAVGVAVYWDAELSQSVTSISWGVIEPGGNVTRSVYIQNVGNAPVTISMWTQNWNPANASTYVTLTWNYMEQTINPNEAIPVVLTLSVSLDVTGFTNFSFDIIIAAVG